MNIICFEKDNLNVLNTGWETLLLKGEGKLIATYLGVGE